MEVKKFKDLLKSNGLNEQSLAKSIGKSQQAISKWINGLAIPRTKDLSIIARKLNVTIEELLSCFNNK
jgi:transcriptional regulator with XRE-family HTH domain